MNKMTSTHVPLVLQKCVEEYKSTHEEVLKSELKFVEKCANYAGQCVFLVQQW